VELIVNGVSLGRRKSDTDPLKANLRRPPFTFPICWQPGEVVAKGWTQGEVQATCTVRTPEAPARIELGIDMEGRDLLADGADIVLAYARIVDDHGTTVRDYEGEVTFSVDGPAEVVGGPEIGSNPVACADGIAPVLVRAGLDAGPIALRAQAGDLQPAIATVESVPAVVDAIAAAARPIYDLPRVRLDLGGAGQHVQYGWTSWTGAGDTVAACDLPWMGTVTLRPGMGGSLYWRGESNVPGPLGFVAEDGVCALGELTLELAGLEAGTYRLRTYHHGPSSDTDAMDPLHGKSHAADIANLPPAVCLDVVVDETEGDARTLAAYIPQGAGKRVLKAGPSCADVTFHADGVAPVYVHIRSTDGRDSVWLNGLDIRACP
jgi:beta-galactosidase